MNMLWLIYVVLYSGCLGVYGDPKTWVDSLFKHIKHDIEAYQITLISNFEKSARRSPTVDNLLSKIVENFATVQINVAGPNILYKDIVHHTAKDTSMMFFILVSHETLSRLSSEKLINTAENISTFNAHPQMLLVLGSQVSDSLEEFLYFAWTKRMIDFTIVELVNTSKSEIGFQREVASPVIHQLDPFKKKYTKSRWTLSTEWFPDKVGNMWGVELKIGVSNIPPFTNINITELQKPTNVRGANVDIMSIIAGKLNFSLNFINLDLLLENCGNASDHCLYYVMRSGKVDILCYLSTHHTDFFDSRISRTEPIHFDQLCPVVPVLPRVKMPFSMEFFTAYALCFSIIMIFWIVSYILRFRDNLWQPFSLVKIFFGITLTHQPTRISERTLFACILFVSAIYSSNIYTAITGISLQTNSEMEFKTFEDLDRSGLTPIIHRFLFNKTFGQSDGVLNNIKRNVAVSPPQGPLYECPLIAAKHKNVTCLMIRKEAEVVLRWYESHKKYAQTKIVEPCFWSDSTAFLLAEGSPYRARINDVIIRLHSTGLLSKAYESTKHYSWKRSHENDQVLVFDTKENMIALRNQLLAIVIVGYTVSSIIFITEIAVHRILKCI